MVQPKTLPPSMRGETSRPECPSLRVLVTPLLFLMRCPFGRNPGAFSEVAEGDGSFYAVVGGDAGVMNGDDVLIFNDAHLELDGGVLDGAGDFRFPELAVVDA